MASRSGLLRSTSMHRCMLVLTFGLLLCEIVASRLCNSLINMVDGFHTLFILLHMALPLPYPSPHPRVPRDPKKPFLCASDVSPASPHLPFPSSPPHPSLASPHPPFSSSPPHPSPSSPRLPSPDPLSSTPTQSPVKSLPFISADRCVSPIPPSSPCPTLPLSPPHPNASPQCTPKTQPPTTIYYISPEASISDRHSPVPHLHPSPSSHAPSPPPSLTPSPPPPPSSPPPLPSPRCGLVYSEARLQPVGSLISALLLAALCVSVCLEIISHTLQPHLVQRPLLVTVVGAMSLLHNLLVLGLGRGSQQGGGTVREEERSSRDNGRVEAKEQTTDRSAEGCVDNPRPLDDSFQGGTLVLCNPGASSVLDPDCPDSAIPQSQETSSSPGDRLRAAAPQPYPSQPYYEAPTGCLDTHSPHTHLRQTGAWDPHSATQTAPSLTPALQSDPSPDSRPQTRSWITSCFPALVTLTKALLGSILVLTNGLVLLQLAPSCLHDSGDCGHLLYLDPGFSMLAVLVLLTTALPQVCRVGQLLLQACPPQVRVSDLGRRISSVPGVWAVHELHVWQLTESCLVASVHVHCHTGFQTHRYGDLLSGVTKVLQSVGVSCWTIQPEFISPTSNSNLDNNTSPPTLVRDPPPPHPSLPCSLACGRGCAEKMCCWLPEEETAQPAAPSAGEAEEEPQVLVIENTFL